MNITVNSRVLAQELRLLNTIVPTKASIPALTHVLFRAHDSLHLSATDFEVGLTTPCPATILEQGAFTLPAKTLLAMVEQIPDTDVRLVVNDRGHVIVTAGTFRSRLQALSPDDFPTMPKAEGMVITMGTDMLRSLITRTRYAISDTATRYVVAGALLTIKGSMASMVATDGTRLSVAAAPRTPGSGQMDLSILIPTKTLDTLVPYCKEDRIIAISTSAQHLFFEVSGRLLSSRQLAGDFPNYQRIIPTYSEPIPIDRVAFAAALRRVGLVSDSVSLSFHQDLSLYASSAEVGEANEHVPIIYSGAPVTLRVPWRPLLDFLNAATSPTITIGIGGSDRPIRLDDTDFCNVVMVMK